MPKMHEALVLIPALHKLNIAVNSCNPSTEMGELEVQGHPWPPVCWFSLLQAGLDACMLGLQGALSHPAMY